jgi:hypothetical protein
MVVVPSDPVKIVAWMVITANAVVIDSITPAVGGKQCGKKFHNRSVKQWRKNVRLAPAKTNTMPRWGVPIPVPARKECG